MSNGDQGTAKGLSPWAWVAIGCGGVALLAFIVVAGAIGFGIFKAKEVIGEFQDNPAKAAAVTMVRLDPDLELIETDDVAGTITFKDLETGEVTTVGFEDFAEGELTITTDEGETQIDFDGDGEDGGGVTITGPDGTTRFGASAGLEDVPDWVPIYPGATETQSNYSARTAEGATGLLSAKTGDDAEDVIEHYREWFEEQGWEIGSTSSTTTGEDTIASIMGELESGGRTLNVGVFEQGGETRLTLNYGEKPE